MKKICFIVSEAYSIGGEQTVLAKVANSLVNNYEITIYTHENVENKIGNEKKYDSRIRVVFVNRLDNDLLSKIHRTLYKYYCRYINGGIIRVIHRKRLYPPKMLDFWIKEINDKGYDYAVSVSGYKSYSRLLSYISDDVRAKTIGWEHSSFEAYFTAKNCYYPREEEEFSWCWKRLNKLILLNDDIRYKVKANLGVEGVVINNPCTFETNIKADSNAKNIVSVGRLEFEKGFSDIIRAFSVLHGEFPDWSLTIVGDGSQRRELEKLVHEKGIEDSVSFLGYLKDVKSELLNASIFVMASKWEGMPMTILEALECGLPIVGYDIPALVSMLSEGRDSYLVKLNEINELSDSLKKLMSDDEIRKKMGIEASKTAKKYSIDEVAVEWEKILK